jgi:hypothetical protein
VFPGADTFAECNDGFRAHIMPWRRCHKCLFDTLVTGPLGERSVLRCGIYSSWVGCYNSCESRSIVPLTLCI